MSTKVVLAHSLARSMKCSVPFGRFGTADEVAKVVVFLASDEKQLRHGNRIVYRLWFHANLTVGTERKKGRW